jgi:hypothetical protein
VEKLKSDNSVLNPWLSNSQRAFKTALWALFPDQNSPTATRMAADKPTMAHRNAFFPARPVIFGPVKTTLLSGFQPVFLSNPAFIIKPPPWRRQEYELIDAAATLPLSR